MKVLLVGLASIFTEGLTYQDNLLADQLKKDGNDVTLIVDCFKYLNGRVTPVEEEDRILANGIRLIRKKYINFFGDFVSSKVRAVHGLYDLIESINPDIIFHHSLQTYEMITILKYKKNHPNIKFFVDSHEDFHNSATNLLSKYVLHRIFYRNIIRKCLPFVDRVFCVSYESFEFLNKMYKIKYSDMEFFPLGGQVLDKDTRDSKRDKVRSELCLSSTQILLVHSGKLNVLKKTNELLEGFSKIRSDRFRLVLIGLFDDETMEKNQELIMDDYRIKYIGWKSGGELVDYLCACDLYIQPGTQSATMQIAACCGSAVAIYPYSSHKYLMSNSAFYIENFEDISNLLYSIDNNPEILQEKRYLVNKVAKEKLDYKNMANRLYE